MVGTPARRLDEFLQEQARVRRTVNGSEPRPRPLLLGGGGRAVVACIPAIRAFSAAEVTLAPSS